MAEARACGRERSTRVFLAGGVVRDLLLGRPIRDVDLVVERDGPGFARRLGERLGADVRIHGRFGTATLTRPDGLRLDIAEARRERYESPGALPSVEPGASIEEDLARRDFTINAVAVELGRVPRLVDPLGGRADLSKGIVRILHERSFVEDPTRALRAVRYANRLGFALAPATRSALRAALDAGALDRISADRLRRELRLLFEESERSSAVARMEALGLDAAIHPALARRPGARTRLRRTEALAGESGAGWLGYLLAWMGTATPEEAADIARRLGLSGSEARELAAWPQVPSRFPANLRRRSPGEIRRAARGLSADELAAAAASLPAPDGRALRDAMVSAPATTLSIRGADLRAAGIPVGPAIGRALARTLEALELGRIGPDDELAFAVRAAREEEP